MFPKWDDWNIAYTKRGIWNIRRTRATRALAVLLAVVGAYRLRQSGMGFRDIKDAIRSLVQGSVASLGELLTLLRKQLTV